jgi:hypothetical protein
MVVGLACAFLLTIAALLLRFGIPRSDLPTLANVKWFALGLTVFFAFLALLGLAGMGKAAFVRDAHSVSKRTELGALPVGTVAVLEAKISSTMKTDSHGWVASKSPGASTGETPALVVDLADGPLQLAGDGYSDEDWSIDDPGMHLFLQPDDPVTVIGRVVHDPKPTLEAETVFTGHRTAGLQKKAHFDFLVSAVGTLASALSAPGIALLLLLAARRRRRLLSA